MSEPGTKGLRTKLLDLVCHGDQRVFTSPSGSVKVYLCEGWCESWAVGSESYWLSGWRFRGRHRIIEALEILRGMLVADQQHEAVLEVDRLLASVE